LGVGGWGQRSLLNRYENTFEVAEDVEIRDPEHPNSLVLNPCVAHRIGRRIDVRHAITSMTSRADAQ
jgi:hypothetical protein